MAIRWVVQTEDEAKTLEERAASHLRLLIRDGSLPPGYQLPPEPELATLLGVSRPTLRSAITELVGERLVVRRRGIGTFICQHPYLSQGLERLRGSAESIRVSGRAPGTRNLKVSHSYANEELATQLQLSVGAPLVHISRTRTADGVAVLHCEEWIPEDLLPVSTALDSFGDEDSVYDRLAHIGLSVSQALARFVPLIPDDWLRRRLEISHGFPVLLLEQQHFHERDSDAIILFSKNYCNMDRMDIHTVRTN